MVCVMTVLVPRDWMCVGVPLARLVCGLVVRHNYYRKSLEGERFVIAANHVADFGMWNGDARC
jgi:hypothetical protein